MKSNTGKMVFIIGLFAIFFIAYITYPSLSIEIPKRGDSLQINSEVSHKKEEVMRLIQQHERKGLDTARAKSLLEQSRIAMRNGDTRECARLLDEAFALLGHDNITESKQNSQSEVADTKMLSIELPVNAGRFQVTELVPTVASGKDINSYTSAFKSYSLNAENGSIKLFVGSIPLVVEEILKQQRTKTPHSNCGNSPFGLHDIDSFDDSLVDLGTCWIRHAGRTALIWDIAEPEKGKFNWSRTDNVLNDIYKNKMDMVVVINSFNSWDQGVEPRERGERSSTRPEARDRTKMNTGNRGRKIVKNIDAYESFLQRAVKRYSFVKAWQIENEPNSPRIWADSPENYLTLLKASYQAIKQANPNAMVVIGGVSDPTAFNGPFWSKVFQELKKYARKERYFDVFDAHWFLHESDYTESFDQFAEYIKDIRKRLDEVGYNDVPIWIGEMASYSGSPFISTREGAIKRSKPFISERQHAGELVKLYIRALELGVSKAFWVRMIEWSGYNPMYGYFDNTGLINNPRNDGESHKKLAYYSYKKLIELFDGIDMKTLQVLNLGGNIYTYKFIKNGHSLYFIWYN